ncbi:hypothetical protein FPT15_12270 [Pseudomonas sp. RGB]|nr:hypothetical protein FPT15_12270 [Pseudomonas sp. RGB]
MMVIEGCCGCVSVAAVTAAGGCALTAGHCWQTPGMPAQPKVTKRSVPHHSAPRPADLHTSD